MTNLYKGLKILGWTSYQNTEFLIRRNLSTVRHRRPRKTIGSRDPSPPNSYLDSKRKIQKPKTHRVLPREVVVQDFVPTDKEKDSNPSTHSVNPLPPGTRPLYLVCMSGAPFRPCPVSVSLGSVYDKRRNDFSTLYRHRTGEVDRPLLFMSFG